jgi:hypothetical protein
MTEEEIRALIDETPWVTVPDVPVTKEEITRYSGSQCSEFYEGCATCESWKKWHATGTIDIVIERADLLKGLT